MRCNYILQQKILNTFSNICGGTVIIAQVKPHFLSGHFRLQVETSSLITRFQPCTNSCIFPKSVEVVGWQTHTHTYTHTHTHTHTSTHHQTIPILSISLTAAFYHLRFLVIHIYIITTTLAKRIPKILCKCKFKNICFYVSIAKLNKYGFSVLQCEKYLLDIIKYVYHHKPRIDPPTQLHRCIQAPADIRHIARLVYLHVCFIRAIIYVYLMLNVFSFIVLGLYIFDFHVFLLLTCMLYPIPHTHFQEI